MIEVDYQTNYLWSQYLRTDQIEGEFGFYIDEYNANGDWISGQWKGMAVVDQDGTIQISYLPTNSNVKKVGLQYYFLGDSASVYIDLVKFLVQ